MLDGQWLPLARLFDRLEVGLRRLGGGLVGLWRSVPTAAGALDVLSLFAAVGYGVLRLFAG
jgi:hypothetical protein